jgi:hypothetical protein
MGFQKRILVTISFLAFISIANAITLSADLFDYDENKIEQEFRELTILEAQLIENPNLTFDQILNQNPAYRYLLTSTEYSPFGITNISAPGKIPSFWWAFSLSIIGSYTLYGAVAGPIAVGVVYFSTEKNKEETKKAIYGCLTGTILGLGIRYIVSNAL